MREEAERRPWQSAKCASKMSLAWDATTAAAVWFSGTARNSLGSLTGRAMPCRFARAAIAMASDWFNLIHEGSNRPCRSACPTTQLFVSGVGQPRRHWTFSPLNRGRFGRWCTRSLVSTRCPEASSVSPRPVRGISPARCWSSLRMCVSQMWRITEPGTSTSGRSAFAIF